MLNLSVRVTWHLWRNIILFFLSEGLDCQWDFIPSVNTPSDHHYMYFWQTMCSTMSNVWRMFHFQICTVLRKWISNFMNWMRENYPSSEFCLCQPQLSPTYSYPEFWQWMGPYWQMTTGAFVTGLVHLTFSFVISFIKNKTFFSQNTFLNPCGWAGCECFEVFFTQHVKASRTKYLTWY